MPDTMVAEPRVGPPPEDRGHERYEGRLEAYLWMEGGWWHCWIRDISLGGAGLEPAIPAALGKRASLTSPYFDFKGQLPGRVINVADDRTCLAFDLDPALRDQLARFITANT